MSRPLRIEYPNAFYHVMNRGANRKPIYHIDDDYGVFLETLKETAKLFGIKILCFALMPNHYHLLVTTPKANLSRAMRHLNGVYTQRHNRIHKKDGPLFRGRYKAILVQEDEYLTHLIRYIHLNPISANLTQDLSKYPRTSHKDYLKGQDQSPWLHIRLGLAFFASSLKKALGRYQEFMKGGVDPKTAAFYGKKNQSPILGDPDFLNHIKETYILSDRKLSTEIPEAISYQGQKKADLIAQETSRLFKKPKEALYASRRGETNDARLIAVALTRDLSGLRLSEIAKTFGMNSYKSVSSSCYRLKSRLAKEPSLRKSYNQLHHTCGQKEI